MQHEYKMCISLKFLVKNVKKVGYFNRQSHEISWKMLYRVWVSPMIVIKFIQFYKVCLIFTVGVQNRFYFSEKSVTRFMKKIKII